MHYIDFSEEHAITPSIVFTCVAMFTGEIIIYMTRPAGNSNLFAVETCEDKYYCYSVNYFFFFKLLVYNEFDTGLSSAVLKSYHKYPFAHECSSITLSSHGELILTVPRSPLACLVGLALALQPEIPPLFGSVESSDLV